MFLVAKIENLAFFVTFYVLCKNAKTYYSIISLIDQNENYYQIFGIESVSYHQNCNVTKNCYLIELENNNLPSIVVKVVVVISVVGAFIPIKPPSVMVLNSARKSWNDMPIGTST